MEYYKALGVEPFASQEDIERAYWALLYASDLDTPAGVRAQDRVEEAFLVLCDKTLRALYHPSSQVQAVYHSSRPLLYKLWSAKFLPGETAWSLEYGPEHSERLIRSLYYISDRYGESIRDLRDSLETLAGIHNSMLPAPPAGKDHVKTNSSVDTGYRYRRGWILELIMTALCGHM